MTCEQQAQGTGSCQTAERRHSGELTREDQGFVSQSAYGSVQGLARRMGAAVPRRRAGRTTEARILAAAILSAPTLEAATLTETAADLPGPPSPPSHTQLLP